MAPDVCAEVVVELALVDAWMVDATGEERAVIDTAFVIMTADAVAVVVAIGFVMVIVVCKLTGHQRRLDSQPTMDPTVALAGREVAKVVVVVVVCLTVVVALL